MQPRLPDCHNLTRLPLQGAPPGVMDVRKYVVRARGATTRAIGGTGSGILLGVAQEKKAYIFGCRKAKKETPAKVINPAREDGA